MKSRLRARAFSLIEVVLALGIAAFSVLAMIGFLPEGLKQASASITETRAAQLAQTLFASLHASPFEAADCFGTTLDLSTLDEASPPVVLHAGFPASGLPFIQAAANSESIYSIELRFRKIAVGSAPVAANEVTVTVFPRGGAQAGVRFQSIVGSY